MSSEQVAVSSEQGILAHRTRILEYSKSICNIPWMTFILNV